MQAFNEYIKKEIELNDLKEIYKKKTQKNLCNNIIKLLNLSNKEKIYYLLVLNGVKYEDIAKINNVSISTIKNTIARVKAKIEKIKSELYINYMKLKKTKTP